MLRPQKLGFLPTDEFWDSERRYGRHKRLLKTCMFLSTSLGILLCSTLAELSGGKGFAKIALLGFALPSAMNLFLGVSEFVLRRRLFNEGKASAPPATS